MKLADLLNCVRISSKIQIVDATDPTNQHEIWKGWQTLIDDETNPEFWETYEKYGHMEVINFGTNTFDNCVDILITR